MLRISFLATVTALACLLSAGSAFADALFETSLRASTGGGVAVAGVQSTGVAFSIDPGGEVRVTEQGDFKAEFTGLLHPNGTPTAEEVFASLVCSGAIVYSSTPVPIDFVTGSAKIEEFGVITDEVATECLRPIVLIRRNGCTIAGGCNIDDPANTRWLAISGFVPPVAVP